MLLNFTILLYFVLSLPSLEVKAELYFVSSSYMLLDKKALLKIWLNPGLNVTIFRGTAPRSQNKKNMPHFILYKLWRELIRKLHFLSNLTDEHIYTSTAWKLRKCRLWIADWFKFINSNVNMTDVLEVMLKCCGGFFSLLFQTHYHILLFITRDSRGK